jgi:hypothetical protein
LDFSRPTGRCEEARRDDKIGASHHGASSPTPEKPQRARTRLGWTTEEKPSQFSLTNQRKTNMINTLSRHIQIRTALEKDNIFTLKQADQLARVIDAHLPLQNLSEADVDRVVARHRDEIVRSLKQSVEHLERQITRMDRPIYDMMNRTEDTLVRFSFNQHPMIMAFGGAVLGILIGLSIPTDDPLQSGPLGGEGSSAVSGSPFVAPN